MDEAKAQNGIIKVMISAYNGKKDRVILALYQALLKSRGNSTMYMKEKWDELEKN